MCRAYLLNNQSDCTESREKIEVVCVFFQLLHLVQLAIVFAVWAGEWLLSPSVILAKENRLHPLLLSGPDLMVESLTLTPPNPDVGQPFDINVVIRNQGDADVVSDFRVYMYVDPVDILPTQATPYTTRTSIFGLETGLSFTWGRTNEVFTTEGKHHVCIWVDRDGEIAEEDESNNINCIETHEIFGRFEVVPTYTLPDAPMLLMASLRDDAGELISSQQTITASVGGNEVQLNDSGQNGDFEAEDDLYGVWCDAGDVNPLSVKLYAAGELLDTKSVTITQQPRLLVLTDFGHLYEEFLDTGTTRGEDWDIDGESDYLQLVQRIYQYAAVHQGTVGDLPHEITSARGYTENYALLSYASESSTTNRFRMAELIDQLIYQLNVSTEGTIENIALIGDDEVVPFYRVKDPIDQYREGGSAERKYFSGDAMRLENPSLADSGDGYILSDVPYSTRVAINPFQMPLPSPQMGIGRIFASSPYRLTWMIDRYEQPLNLRSFESRASLFYPRKSNVDFPLLVNREGGALQYFNNYFGKSFLVYSENSPWKANDFARQLALSDLTFLWGHATHLNVRIQTQGYDGEIWASDLSCCETSQPSVFFGGGCHLGYTTAHYPNGESSRYYDDAIVLSLLEKGVTSFAPTSEGYLVPEYSPNLTELLLLGVFNQLMDVTLPNVGSAWQDAFTIYHTQDPYWINNNNIYRDWYRSYHTAVAYGSTVYGLPTQPFNSSMISVAQVNSVSTKRLSFFPSQTIETLPEFEIDVPEFRGVQNDQGEWIYSIPQGGSQVIPPNGPALPLVVRNYLLPRDTTVFTVTQVGTPTFDVVSGVTLANSELWTLNGDRITTTCVLPNPYPSQRYWWTVTQGEDGTLVTLSVVPLEYDSFSRTVKQFHHLEFDIEYVIAFGDDPTIDSLQINNGQTVTLNNTMIPVVVDIGSDITTQLDLVWKARNTSGFVENSGQVRLPVSSGTTRGTFEMGSENWKAGPLSFSFGLFQDGQVIDSENVEIMMQGPRIIMQEISNYVSDAFQAKWRLEIINEEGEILEGLGSKFSVSVDDEIVSFGVSEVAPGNYELQVPLDSLPIGHHTIQIQVTDLRGIQTSWRSVISRHAFIYLPLVLRGTP